MIGAVDFFELFGRIVFFVHVWVVPSSQEAVSLFDFRDFCIGIYTENFVKVSADLR